MPRSRKSSSSISSPKLTSPGSKTKEDAFSFGSTTGLYFHRNEDSVFENTFSNPTVSVENLASLGNTRPDYDRKPNDFDEGNKLNGGNDVINNNISDDAVLDERQISIVNGNGVLKHGKDVTDNAWDGSSKQPLPADKKWMREMTSESSDAFCSGRRMFITSVLMVITVIAANCIVIYFALRGNLYRESSSKIHMPETSTHFLATIRIRVTDGEQNSSTYYLHMAQLPDVITAAVDDIMTSDEHLSSIYVTSRTYIKHGSNGSIVADIHLSYSQKTETKKVQERLKELSHLKFQDKKEWKVDPDIKIKAWQASFYLPTTTSPAGGTSTDGATKLMPSATRTSQESYPASEPRTSLQTADTDVTEARSTQGNSQAHSKTYSKTDSSTSLQSSTHSMTSASTAVTSASSTVEATPEIFTSRKFSVHLSSGDDISTPGGISMTEPLMTQFSTESQSHTSTGERLTGSVSSYLSAIHPTLTSSLLRNYSSQTVSPPESSFITSPYYATPATVSMTTLPTNSTVLVPTTQSPEFHCNVNQFRCVSGQCVFAHQRCDARSDCDDGSDEANCSGVCERGRYRCPDGKCIMREWLCDGHWDCENGSDEQGCGQCQSTEFQCSDYSCVPMVARCDGIIHCNDSSDEHLCVKVDEVSGVVQVYHQGSWLPICSEGVNSSVGEDVCTSTGSGYLQRLSSVSYSSSSYLFYQPNSSEYDSFLGFLQKRDYCSTNNVIVVKCAELVCGTTASNILRPYVVHGNVAPRGRWPWQVSIHKLLNHVCGGVVLTDRHILTAAHCLEGYTDSPNIFEAVLGTNKIYTIERRRVTAQIHKMWLHPKYKSFKEGHDIAVLMLKNPIQFSDKIRPVCLPRSSSHRFPITAQCYVTGWGYTDYYSKSTPDDLQEAKMQLWNTTKCNSTEFYNSSLPSSVLCAGYLSGYISICPGDSGGPLMCQDEHGRWRIVGISSFMASGCDVPFRPSVFTDVLKEMDFIQSTTSCQFRCDNGGCLYDETLICNRVNNCGDNSDEIKPCDFNITCTFEDIFICGYQEDVYGKMNWTRHRGDTPTADTGPRGDYSGHGYYMYLEASDGKPKDTATLWSPAHNTTQTSCLQFHYHMSGANIGTLVVRKFFIDGNTTKVMQLWKAQGDQGNKWRMGQVEIMPGTFRIGFMAIRGDGVFGDMAIDSITLLPGTCPPFSCASDEFKCYTKNQCINKEQECDVVIQCTDNSDEAHCNWSVDCNFETSTMCGWANYHLTYPNYAWRWHAGSTPTKGTGPDVDHTTGTSQGYYVYLGANNGKLKETSFLLSKSYTASESYWCVEFYYHMLGPPGEKLTQRLKLWLYTGEWFLMWTAEYSSGDKWILVRQNLQGRGTYHIGFQGKKVGSGNASDIALDDIKTYDGKCPPLSCPQGKVKCAQNLECIDNTKVCDGFSNCLDAEDEQDCASASSLFLDCDGCEAISLDCNFDQLSMCRYSQSPLQRLNWLIWQKFTPSRYTGPYYDHTTPRGLGYYLYVEASSNAGKKSQFYSPALRLTQPHCLRFHYHMFGSDMGHLEVFVVDPSNSNVKLTSWYLAGNQGNKWRYAQLTIPAPGRRQIFFEAQIGSNVHSDIAVDDIFVRRGVCPEYVCPSGEYTCRNNSKCIPKHLVCDTFNDCYDYDDEKTCTCNAKEFQCDMGMCIPGFRRCDQIQDCPDNSDEKNCTCSSGYQQCLKDDVCIPSEWFCDRERDCSDGSDEWNCTTCTPEQFICKDYFCVPNAARCDGIKQCPDGSDEHDCVRVSSDQHIVSIFHKNHYVTICNTTWQETYNDEICRSLGHESTLSSGTATSFHDTYLSLVTPLSSVGLLGSFTSSSFCQDNKVVKIECQPKVCGQPVESIIVTYITNAKPAKIVRWPWMVSITKERSFMCGGTLINPELVLTAAHCFDEYLGIEVPLEKFTFIFGSEIQVETLDTDPPQVLRSARKIILHPKMDLNSFTNDIAMVFLDKPVDFSQQIKPACLPDFGDEFPTSSLCYTTGWGSINAQMESPDRLQEAKMKLWSREKCNYRNYWNGHIHETQFCAGYDEGPHTICPGDSGGPLTCLNNFNHWSLVGIVSFFSRAAGCTTKGQPPNGFTKVSMLKPWVDATLASECKFNCSNGRCLYNSDLICDNQDDCGDNSDEQAQCNLKSACPQGDDFHCGNGTCISKSRYCDGLPDCQNGEDEPLGCQCDASQYLCRNGRQCIHKDRLCDHRIDCWDRSDETFCKCDGEYKCTSGLCIPLTYRCNGKNDCDDFSDEMNCTCKPTQFKCNNSICISSEDVCNGIDECGDNSDETADCNSECQDYEYKCPDGRCILLEWKCDSYQDCADGSDENECATCNATDFQCRDYTCVPIDSRCDGIVNCVDQSDEEGCFKLYPASDRRSGMVRKNVRGTWHAVCYTHWNQAWSDRICQEVGYGSALLTSKVINSDVPFTAALENFNDTVLLASNFVEGPCTSGEAVNVSCKEKECGQRSSSLTFVTTYVMGGQFAQEGEWPWMGAVYYLGRFQCGATLISEGWLVTAAHCFYPNKHVLPHNVNVTVGTISSQDPGSHSETYAVKAIIPNPNYHHSPLPQNDIALVRLVTPVTRTDYIRPVCLPKDRKVFGGTSHCYVAGWGITNRYGMLSTDRLREAKMRLWSSDRCSGVFSEDFNNDTMLCAGYDTGYITACSGDSGGPLVCLDGNQNWILIGTLSFGMDCSTVSQGKMKPDVYTKVAYYKEWIKEVLSKYETQ